MDDVFDGDEKDEQRTERPQGTEGVRILGADEARAVIDSGEACACKVVTGKVSPFGGGHGCRIVRGDRGRRRLWSRPCPPERGTCRGRPDPLPLPHPGEGGESGPWASCLLRDRGSPPDPGVCGLGAPVPRRAQGSTEVCPRTGRAVSDPADHQAVRRSGKPPHRPRRLVRSSTQCIHSR